MKEIQVPTINDGVKDFAALANLHKHVLHEIDNDTDRGLVLNFAKCEFLRCNAVATIGGIIKLAAYRQVPVEIDWESVQENILANLIQNGFAHSFSHEGEPRQGNSIPYREDSDWDHDKIIDYLTDKWLGRGWIDISDRLRNDIISNVCEIYNNAFEHGDSAIGAYTCGQHHPNQHELLLSVVDFGVGIPQKVRTFLEQHGNDKDKLSMIKDHNLMRWAFKSGSTTKDGAIRGSSGRLGAGII